MPHAAVVYRTDEPMKIEEIRYRDLSDDEALVKVAACGLCHSDLSVLNEYFPSPLPTILGHEAAGVVEEVGARVVDVVKGDHVVAVWKPSCGVCRYCMGGRPQMCKLGLDTTGGALDRAYVGETAVSQFMGIGGFSEYTILKENALLKIDPSMPLEKAALIGCGVLTGIGAVRNAAMVAPGQEVAVFGCGGVGLNIIQGARLAQAATIVGIDRDPAKLELARRFGATHTFATDTPKLHRVIRSLTRESQGVDHAFDAVGSGEVAAAALRTLCRGGELTLVGIDRMDRTFPISQFQTVMTEKTIRGSLCGSSSSAEVVPGLIEMYQRGELMVDPLVTRRYSLNEANEAMDDLRKGKNARGVLIFE